jgi:hypothetical protein
MFCREFLKLGITLFSGYFYEVVDINDNRIDKFLVTILPDNLIPDNRTSQADGKLKKILRIFTEG